MILKSESELTIYIKTLETKNSIQSERKIQTIHQNKTNLVNIITTIIVIIFTVIVIIMIIVLFIIIVVIIAIVAMKTQFFRKKSKLVPGNDDCSAKQQFNLKPGSSSSW